MKAQLLRRSSNLIGHHRNSHVTIKHFHIRKLALLLYNHRIQFLYIQEHIPQRPSSCCFSSVGSMEASQALQRCARYALQQSTRRPLPTWTSHTLLRPQLQCANSQLPRRNFSSTSAQNDSGRPSLQDLLRDFKKDLRSGQAANERLDSLMGNPISTPRSRSPSNLGAFEDTLGAGDRSRSGTDSELSLSSFVASLNQDQLDPYADINLRLKPSLGRTVRVVSGDPSRAFRMLERRCQENKIRMDEIEQRFHVRRGQRKKLLRMKRWRALFREGFIAECDKVRRMRKQGW